MGKLKYLWKVLSTGLCVAIFNRFSNNVCGLSKQEAIYAKANWYLERWQGEDHSVSPYCNILHKLYILLTAEHGTTMAYMFSVWKELRYSLSQRLYNTRIERYLQPKCLSIYVTWTCKKEWCCHTLCRFISLTSTSLTVSLSVVVHTTMERSTLLTTSCYHYKHRNAILLTRNVHKLFIFPKHHSYTECLL